MADAAPVLLEGRNLTKRFHAHGGKALLAVDDVSLSVPERSTVGIVGESGCGKSTLARLIVGLLKRDDGEILFDGQYLAHDKRDATATRNIQMVFQDPYSALNPQARSARASACRCGSRATAGRDTRERVGALLEQVGPPRQPRVLLPAPDERRPAPARQHRAGAGARTRSWSCATRRCRRWTSRSRRRS